MGGGGGSIVEVGILSNKGLAFRLNRLCGRSARIVKKYVRLCTVGFLPTSTSKLEVPTSTNSPMNDIK
jgi:hypothetical protein